MSNKFFTANGTPARAGAGSPRASAVIDGLGANKGTLLGHCREGIEQRVVRPDARKRRFDDAQRAGAAGSDSRGDFAGRVPGEIARRCLKHGTPAPARHRPTAETDRPAPRVCRMTLKIMLDARAPRRIDPERKGLRVGSDQHIDDVGRFRRACSRGCCVVSWSRFYCRLYWPCFYWPADACWPWPIGRLAGFAGRLFFFLRRIVLVML